VNCVKRGRISGLIIGGLWGSSHDVDIFKDFAGDDRMMDGWMIFGGIFVVEADHNHQENGNKMFFAYSKVNF
jgi:hypothetical protein